MTTGHVSAKKARSAHEQETVVRALPTELRKLERLFDEAGWPDRRAFLKVRREARKRALDTLGDGSSSDSRRTAVLVASAAVIIGMREELLARPSDLARLAEQIEATLGVSRLALARELVRSPELL